MKELPLTAIILLCFFACTKAQNTPERDKIQPLVQDIGTALVSVGKAPAPKTTGIRPSLTPLIRVYNNYPTRDLSHVRLEWELLVNGVPGPKGMILNLIIAARQSKEIRLPAKIPTGPGEEVFLNVRYALKKQEPPHPAGTIIAKQQLLLKKAKVEELNVVPAGELTFADEEGLFTINAPLANARFQFSKQTGWLESVMLKGAPILDDSLGLKPDFRVEPHLQLFSTSTSSELVIIRSDYTLPEVTRMLHVRYTINAKGEMLVDQVMEADTTAVSTPKDSTAGRTDSSAKDGRATETQNTTGRDGAPPQLPHFGMLWPLPSGYDSIAYYGIGSPAGEDADMENGIYRQSLGPAGTWTSVRWWKVMDKERKGLSITADSCLLNIGAYPLAGEGRTRIRLDIYRPSIDIGGTGSYHISYKCSFIP